ncbi:DUF6452 family protein [Prevotella sp. P6B1]|uniref:DUF6452 family protein n=1 Tax=Prevotella sp. P6B1 TaxID=1410613 RepID=UPI00068B4FE2|nr:DUF6452 family protein [Prevotella sp. P6B1]
MMKRLVYLFLMVLMTACSSIDCPVNNTVATLYQIRNSDGTELKLTDTMTISTVRADENKVVLYNGRDSIILNKGIGISKFTLPISYSHPEDVLLFQFDNNDTDLHVTDTVWIKKNDYPHFESVDCNTAFFHTLTDVKYTCHHIDSLVINNPSVTYDYQTAHFYLYPKSGN